MGDLKRKTVLVLAIAVAFILGTMVVGAEDVFAKKDKATKLEKECKKDKKNKEPLCELLGLVNDVKFQVDSFFDVSSNVDARVTTIETEILALELHGVDPSPDGSPDSFFDVFFDVEAYSIDSFFDVFTKLQDDNAKLRGQIFGDPDFDTIGSLQETDEGLQSQIDSFFDVFFDISEEGDRNTIEPLIQLFGDPDFLFGDPDFQVDSFFDISVVLDKRDRHFDTEIVSMQLRGGSPLTVSNIGSSGEDGIQIALPKGSLQSQIDRLELRIAELEP